MQGVNLTRAYESFAGGNSTAPTTGRSGLEGFLDTLADAFGLYRTERGRLARRSVTADNRPALNPSRYPMRLVAEAALGKDWAENFSRAMAPKEQAFFASEAYAVESAAPISPAAYPNVSAFNASISVHMQASILEGYSLPQFIGETLAPTEASDLRAERIQGSSIIGDEAQHMNPGDPHPAVQFSERYVDTPATEKFGMKLGITKEAVFFSRQQAALMKEANRLGEMLGLRREKRIMRMFMGQHDSGYGNDTTKQYTYNGTKYDTYRTSGNWINDHSNELLDHTDLNNARLLAYAMTDQEKGEPIDFMPNAVWTMPAKHDTARYIEGATDVERRTASAAEVHIGRNLEAGRWAIMPPSQHAKKLLTDAVADGGFGLSSANADKYWFFFSTEKPAFVYKENWGADVKTASASDYELLDRDLMSVMFVNEMGAPGCVEPRYVIRNKN